MINDSLSKSKQEKHPNVHLFFDSTGMQGDFGHLEAFLMKEKQTAVSFSYYKEAQLFVIVFSLETTSREKSQCEINWLTFQCFQTKGHVYDANGFVKGLNILMESL